MKKNIGILFGGLSVEHEVSIITGLQAYENINKEKYNISLFYIDKKGEWFTGPKLGELRIYKNWDKNKKKIKSFYPSFNKKDKKNYLTKIDVMIIASHGTTTEDGKLQGLLELLEIPYTSSNIVGSASGMDKIVMKKIFEGLNLPILPYQWFLKNDWEKNRDNIIKNIKVSLSFPLFIKPANLGSSIGISLASNENELINSIEVAAQYDNRIIVEKGIIDASEINCSALKSENEIKLSAMEEPVKWEAFLSFEDKYIHSNSKSKSGMSGMTRKIPAEISKEIENKIKATTINVYKTMDCSGVVRIDYLLNKEKTQWYINEINTIPGSLSFYLWEPIGIKYEELLDLIIKEALIDYEKNKNKLTFYDSFILEKFSGAKGQD